MPTSSLVQRFRAAGWKRLAEAEFLLENGYTTTAMYLAGYSVECLLKALLLSTHPVRKQREVHQSFRGQIAHNFDWLRYRLRQRHLHLPPTIARELVTVGTWTTDWRYEPRGFATKPATQFVKSAKLVVDWSERSLP